MVVYVLPPRATAVGLRFDVTTHGNFYRELSPMLLGPVELVDREYRYPAKNVENAWQYSKVYKEHLCHGGFCRDEPNPHPNGKWWKWAHAGWEKKTADRYPMGKGAVPEFSWWDDQPLDYISAREKIYIPLYQEAVRKYQLEKLLRLWEWSKGNNITLVDFDAYNHHALGMTLDDVLYDPTRKMGHGFVLAMMLEELDRGVPS